MDKMETIGVYLFMAAIFVMAAIICHSISTPTALDVYRGKTTLQITYKDNIPIDSVVVFK